MAGIVVRKNAGAALQGDLLRFGRTDQVSQGGTGEKSGRHDKGGLYFFFGAEEVFCPIEEKFVSGFGKND